MNWSVSIRQDPNPMIARVIITSKWVGNPLEAKEVLKRVIHIWPAGIHVKFLITPGGFIEFRWPEHVTKELIGDSIYPNPEAVKALINEASKYLRAILDKNLLNEVKERADYLTVGMDSHKEISNPKEPHIELVSLINLKEDKVVSWTSKSYPISRQAEGLVRITDLRIHFLRIPDVGEVMILGCHDLKMFDPRHYKRGNMSEWRKETIKELHKIAKEKKVTLALQHPHSTVKVRTWYNAWLYLTKVLPSVKAYASAGKYHEPQRNKTQYDEISKILLNTKKGPTIDFVLTHASN